MNLRRLFVAHAVISGLFGLAFVAVPVQLLSLYGVTLNGGSELIARLFGAVIVGVGLIVWKLRSSPRDVGQLVVLPLFIANSIGLVAYVMAMLAGHVNVLGWGVVAIYAALAAAYGYFAFAKAA